MKKLIPIIIVGIIVLSGLGAAASSTDVSVEITETLAFSTPSIRLSDEYSSLSLKEATSYLMIPGEPVVPKVTQVFILPFGSHILDVSVQFSEGRTQMLARDLRPAPSPLIDGQQSSVTLTKSSEIYQSTACYPNTLYDFWTSTGLAGTQHVVYLSVTCYPVQYIPSEKTIVSYENCVITITYETPSSPKAFPDVYDLCIIAPAEFEEALQPLVDHKIAHSVNTTLVTIEEILSEQTGGRDDAENMKLYIKDTLEQFGANYVLLVGGMTLKHEDWLLPVRYTNNYAGADYEYGVLSDLYFADIYKDNGTAFEDWDSNGNGIFAEYTPTKKDIIDGSPDIYVGRLPCSSAKQVDSIVAKIISYEQTLADESWFKKMLLIGGDTYPDSGPGGYEAEIDTNVSASYMTGFTFERLWTSLGTLTDQPDVEAAINQGAGFIHTAGHANPSILVTHPPESEEKTTILQMYSIPPANAVYALFYYKLGLKAFFEELLKPVNPRLKNGEKQPVVVVGGCHNSQFNTTPLTILTRGFSYAYGWGVHVPKCWSWWLTSKEDGGAIATMGNSGLGMGLSGFDYPNGLDGWLLPRFFYNYGRLGKHHVGEAHSAAITDYVNEFDINTGDADRQMVEQWVLIGDPSLMIGGYS